MTPPSPNYPQDNRRRAIGHHLNFVEPGVPLWKALRDYHHGCDHSWVGMGENLIASRTATPGRHHQPIIDLDTPHRIVESTTPGNHHLYLDTEISSWRWRLLMVALYLAKVIEPGNFWWSMRRGSNFVRPEGQRKDADVFSDEAFTEFFWHHRD